MKRSRIEKVWAECVRLQSAISALHEANVSSSRVGQPERYESSREAATVRRASMDLTRALSDMRKSDYEKLYGEK